MFNRHGFHYLTFARLGPELTRPARKAFDIMGQENDERVAIRWQGRMSGRPSRSLTCQCNLDSASLLLPRCHINLDSLWIVLYMNAVKKALPNLFLSERTFQ